MWSCTAPNCENDLRKKKFFAFPVDKERRKLWTMRCNLTEVPSSAKICEDHFEKSQFLLGQDVKKLKPDAAPSLFLCDERNISDSEKFKTDKKTSQTKKETHSLGQTFPSLFSNPVKLEKGKKQTVVCPEVDFIVLNRKKEKKKDKLHAHSSSVKTGYAKMKGIHPSEKPSCKDPHKNQIQCKSTSLVKFHKSPSHGSSERSSCSTDSALSSSAEESHGKQDRFSISQVSSVAGNLNAKKVMAVGDGKTKNQMHQTKDQLKLSQCENIPGNVENIVSTKPIRSESLAERDASSDNSRKISTISSDIPRESSVSLNIPGDEWIEACSPMFVDRLNAVDQLIADMLCKINSDMEKKSNSMNFDTSSLGSSVEKGFNELPTPQTSPYQFKTEVEELSVVETSSSVVASDDCNQDLESKTSVHAALASAKNYCYVQLMDFVKSSTHASGIEFINSHPSSSANNFYSGVSFDDGEYLMNNNVENSHSETVNLQARKKALVDKQRGRKLLLSPAKKRIKPVKSGMNRGRAPKVKKFTNIHNQTFELVDLTNSESSLSKKKPTRGRKSPKTARKCSVNVNYSGLDVPSLDDDRNCKQSKGKRQSIGAGGAIASKKSRILYCDAFQSLENVTLPAEDVSGSSRLAKSSSQSIISFTEYAKNVLHKTGAGNLVSACASECPFEDVFQLVPQIKHWNEMLSAELQNLRESFKSQNHKFDLLFKSEREKELENQQLRRMNEKLNQQVKNSQLEVSKYKSLVMELELKVSALSQPCTVRVERLEFASHLAVMSEQSKPSSSRTYNDESRLDKKKQLKEKQIEFQNKLLKMLKIKNENKKIDLLIKEFEKEKENEQLQQRIRDLENENKLLLEENEAMLEEVEHYISKSKGQRSKPTVVFKRLPQKIPSNSSPEVDDIKNSSSTTNSVYPSLKRSKPPIQDGRNILNASSSIKNSQLSDKNIPASSVSLNCQNSQLSVKNIQVSQVCVNNQKSQLADKNIPVSTGSLNCQNPQLTVKNVQVSQVCVNNQKSQLPVKNIAVSTACVNNQNSQLPHKSIPADKSTKVAEIRTNSVASSVDPSSKLCNPAIQLGQNATVAPSSSTSTNVIEIESSYMGKPVHLSLKSCQPLIAVGNNSKAPLLLQNFQLSNKTQIIEVRCPSSISD